LPARRDWVSAVPCRRLASRGSRRSSMGWKWPRGSSDRKLGFGLKITRMSSVPPNADPAIESAVTEAVAIGIPSALSDLGDLVRIPGIAWPSFDQTQLERSAERV